VARLPGARRRALMNSPIPPQAAAGITPAAGIIDDIRAGRMVVLVDDEDRENEGDLVLAAQHVTPEAINFMARHGRGLICLTLTEAHCQKLHLPLMVSDNRSPFATNFTVSIEAASGVTTGISAADRARTVKAAVAPAATAADIIQPGHVFPLMARAGGVLMRAGHTEAGCDLAQLAGLAPAAVICEILREDGEMARLPDLLAFAAQHGLNVGTIADLIRHRSETETLVRRCAERQIELVEGRFRVVEYFDAVGERTHAALVYGQLLASEETLVRVHEPASLADLIDDGLGRHAFGVHETLRLLAARGRGVLVLLQGGPEDGDFTDLTRERQLVALGGRKWDPRAHGVGAQILRDLGVGRMRILSRPSRLTRFIGFGLEVTGFLTPEEVRGNTE
jgi:3,4-dihydroxy 2-butanone 4-phosphate synthase/GTP cyclohydrolase II